jgi:hypothetical protein
VEVIARVWQLLVRADGETASAQREIRALQKTTRQFGQKVGKMGRTLTTAVTAPIIALGALGVSELRETMVVTAKTDAVFASMGDTMKVTRRQLSRLVTGLEKYSAIEGDIIQNAANVGLSFKALAGNPKLFNRTMKAAVDMSAALGLPLQQTMVQLGKAMQNGAKGAGALAKNGTLAKDDIAKLQAMAKAGVPMWKQQAFILAAVNKQYAGQGKNVDPIRALTVAVKNIAEAFAVLLLPAITRVSGWIQKLSVWVNGLSGKHREWLGVSLLLAAALGPLLLVVGSMITASAALIPILAGVSATAVLVGAAIAAVTAVLVTAYLKNEDFRTIVDAVGKALWWVAKTVGPAVLAFFKGYYEAMIKAIGAVSSLVVAIAVGLKAAFGWIRDNAAAAWSAVNRAMDVARDVGVAVGNAIGGAVKTAIGWIRDNAAAAWQAVNRAMDAARDVAVAVGGALSGAVKTGLGWVRDNAGSAWSAFKSAVDGVKSVIDAISSGIGKIKEGLNWIATKINNLPSLPSINLPGMARGGITKGVTIAGEAGPEAVIPLGRSAQNTADRVRVMREAGLMGMGGAASSSGPVTINVAPGSGDPVAIAHQVARLLGSKRVAVGGMI